MRKKLVLLVLLAFSIGCFSQEDAFDIGGKAPEFAGKDQHGSIISSRNLLEKNRGLVVLFYRGNWCPYCRKHLSDIQDSLQMILDKDVALVVITPEKPEAIDKMIEETGANFSIIYDSSYMIMNDYKLSFKLSKETVPRAYNYVINSTREANGNNDDVLPVPAAYIIDKNHVIRHKFYDIDYRERISVRELLENISKIEAM